MALSTNTESGEVASQSDFVKLQKISTISGENRFWSESYGEWGL